MPARILARPCNYVVPYMRAHSDMVQAAEDVTFSCLLRLMAAQAVSAHIPVVLPNPFQEGQKEYLFLTSGFPGS